MTTLVPRPPYSQEELDKLYPKGLNLELVQIVSTVTLTLDHRSLSGLSFKEEKTFRPHHIHSPQSPLNQLVCVDFAPWRAFANKCSLSKCRSHTVLALLLCSEAPLIRHHVAERMVDPALATPP